MSKTTIAWFDSLTDGVHALGAAAREFRAAHEGARLASWTVDRTRVQDVHGEVLLPDVHRLVQPHDQAIWRIYDLCSAHERRVKELYEDTARAYAYGTAGAVLAVLDGKRPPYVELHRSGLVGRAVPGGRLPDLEQQLSRWNGSRHLSALRQAVLDREYAADVAEQYADHDGDLADHQASEVTQASEYAAGIANALYAYGEAAESALHFALIAAKGPGEQR
ncbi:hypothetical protein [Streptomyces sp. CC228A]|uniref:hypothetical protein n=1 Tax=Streptomyces sp. CC228A TaxID=2898186 RepID=UPI001F23FFC2|nr:hypothetical protein [Streptomyces sp. CC228A]